MSIPAALAAAQIVVPSATVTSRPSIVSVDRPGGGLHVEWPWCSVSVLPRIAHECQHTTVPRHGPVEVGRRPGRPLARPARAPRSSRRSCRAAARGVSAATRPDPSCSGSDSSRSGSQSSAGCQPSRMLNTRLASTIRRAVAPQLGAVDVPAGDRGQQRRPLGERVGEHAAQELAQDQRVHHRGPVLGLDRGGDVRLAAAPAGRARRTGRPRRRRSGCGRRRGRSPPARAPSPAACAARSRASPGP